METTRPSVPLQAVDKMEMSYQASLCRLDTTMKNYNKTATSSSSNPSTSSSEGVRLQRVQKQNQIRLNNNK